MAEPIPDSWRSEVIRILKTQDKHLIEWTFTARQDWENFGWPYKAYDAMIDALSVPDIKGNKVGMIGARESYEFLFLFRGIRMYAKIGLKEGNLRIIIISAHRAKKPTL
jgi:hypothetical protein